VNWKGYSFINEGSSAVSSEYTQSLPEGSAYDVPYPIYFSFADSINSWWGNAMLADMGVPTYATSLPYNYIALSFWTTSGPADLAYVWATASTSMSFVGGDTPTIQKKIKALYNSKGIKLMISAFGATDFPTSAGKDPIITANSLATFVAGNNVDGVIIDWEDNNAMDAGTGESWLISFQKQLRSQLPNYIIAHTPQAPYFKSEYYKNGAYVTVDKKVGNSIDFYAVQFYNQGDTQYNSYT
jgi:chitinase